MPDRNIVDDPVPFSAEARNDIGGAVVRRPFTFRGDTLKIGTYLTEEEILSIPIANRNALRNNRYIQIFPKAPNSNNNGPSSVFVVHRGGGAYDVIEGTKINDEPLSKVDAEALASPSQEQKIA